GGMTIQQGRYCAAGVLSLVLLGWGAVGATHAQNQGPQIRPDQLTGAHIDGAIDRAIQALYESKDPELQVPYGLEREPTTSWLSESFRTRHAMGNHALTSWALLAAGESYQNPKLYQRINWVFSRDQPLTYD